jgi:NADP-dependent 3-hydroxy acid dehydrogenase YdfG
MTPVNALGFFHITRRVVSRMFAQGDGGHIINVTPRSPSNATQPFRRH